MSDLVSIAPEETASTHEGSWWAELLLTAARYIPGFRIQALSHTFLKAVHGSTWTFLGYGATQIARLATTVLLARLLLGPKEFGLIGLVNVFISGLEMLSDLGIGLDVIQHPRGDEPEFINTAFLIQAGRGVVLWAVATALAYPFAAFYHRPEVLWLAIIAATSIGIRGLSSGSVWTMTRHVQLRKLTLLTVAGEAAGLVVSVAWAIVSPSAWALVVGRVANTLVFVVGTHLVAEYSVSTQWNSKAAKEILAFGTGIFISTSVYFLTGEAERLVIGKFVNLVELGCFSLAITISTAATAGIRQIISQVFFPMIAQSVRNDREKALRQYRNVRLLSLLFSGVLAVGFIAGSRWIVALLLGPKYAMTGWILQLLGFRSALEIFINLTASMLFTVGTSRYHAAGSTAKLFFLVAGLGIAFGRFGFYQAVWVLAVSPVLTYLPLLLGLSRHFRKAMRIEWECFATFLLCSGVAAALWRISA